MSKRDYYEILGVSKTATEKEIKDAYRKLAIKFHPDRNQGDKAAEEKFKEAAEAYDVLGTAEKKQKYDPNILDKFLLTGSYLPKSFSKRNWCTSK